MAARHDLPELQAPAVEQPVGLQRARRRIGRLLKLEIIPGTVEAGDDIAAGGYVLNGIRAGWADRQAAMTLVTRAYHAGRLDGVQYNARLSHIQRAVTQQDLRQLNHDLPMTRDKASTRKIVLTAFRALAREHANGFHATLQLLVFLAISLSFLIPLETVTAIGPSSMGGWVGFPAVAVSLGIIATVTNGIYWAEHKRGLTYA
jgi:hypothetical protein